MSADTAFAAEAASLFAKIADPEIVSEVEDMVETGRVEWRRDPNDRRIAGLVDLHYPSMVHAIVVLYFDTEDFEHDARWFDGADETREQTTRGGR